MKRERNIYKIRAYEVVATVTIFLLAFKVLDMFSLTWFDVFIPLIGYVIFVLFSLLYLVIFWR